MCLTCKSQYPKQKRKKRLTTFSALLCKLDYRIAGSNLRSHLSNLGKFSCILHLAGRLVFVSAVTDKATNKWCLSPNHPVTLPPPPPGGASVSSRSSSGHAGSSSPRECTVFFVTKQECHRSFRQRTSSWELGATRNVSW